MKPLKDLVPSLETCQKLKEAGFEQDTYFYYEIDSDEKDVITDVSLTKPIDGWNIAAPTLGEIEIPAYHYILNDETGFWIECDLPNSQINLKSFDSEIEARAALWLFLNKKH